MRRLTNRLFDGFAILSWETNWDEDILLVFRDRLSGLLSFPWGFWCAQHLTTDSVKTIDISTSTAGENRHNGQKVLPAALQRRSRWRRRHLLTVFVGLLQTILTGRLPPQKCKMRTLITVLWFPEQQFWSPLPVSLFQFCSLWVNCHRPPFSDMFWREASDWIIFLRQSYCRDSGPADWFCR